MKNTQGEPKDKKNLREIFKNNPKRGLCAGDQCEHNISISVVSSLTRTARFAHSRAFFLFSWSFEIPNRYFSIQNLRRLGSTNESGGSSAGAGNRRWCLAGDVALCPLCIIVSFLVVIWLMVESGSELCPQESISQKILSTKCLELPIFELSFFKRCS